MRVLIASDLSDAANVVVRAAVESLGENGLLAACHVLPSPLIQPFVSGSGALFSLPDEAFDDAAEALRRQVAELAGRLPQSMEVFVERGSPYAEIVKCAERWGADVVVVGSHGHGGMRAVLGSVAENVVRFAPCSVLVARADGDGCVLAASDLSDPSLPAIERGWREAQRLGAEFVAMHAIDLGPLAVLQSILSPFSGSSVSPSKKTLEDMESAAKTVLTSSMNRFGARGEAVVVTGSAPGSIISQAEARRASLIVMATRGGGGIERIALGSVAERVVRASTCSVLVVRDAVGKEAQE